MGALTGVMSAEKNLREKANAGPGTDVKASMNPGIASGVENAVNQGNMSTGDIAARSMQNVGNLQQQATLATPQNQAQEAGHLGGNVDAGMQQALANRSSKVFGSHLNQLEQVAKMKAPEIQAQQQQSALHGMAGQEQMLNHMVNTEMVKHQNADAQRNAVVNSVLSLGGGIAGAIAGGPQGAQMGSQLGGALGSIAGGPNTQVQSLNTGD